MHVLVALHILAATGSDTTVATIPAPDIHLVLAVLTLLGLMAVDWVFGAAAAVRAKTFNLRVLDRQLATMILPYFAPVVATLLTQIVTSGADPGTLSQAVAALVYAACAACGQRVLQDIVAKVQALASGSAPAPSPTPSPQPATATPPVA